MINVTCHTFVGLPHSFMLLLKFDPDNYIIFKDFGIIADFIRDL